MGKSKKFGGYALQIAVGIIVLTIILVAILATKTLALSNNKSYQDTPFTINKTDEQKLVTISPTSTLTAEQEKQIQDIQEQKFKINSSLIRFVSGCSILKSPGIEQNIDTSIKYYILQFYSPLNKADPETRAKLAGSGVLLVDYTPDNAFYAKIPPKAFESIIIPLINDKKIRYVGPIPPQAKISQEFVSEVQKNPEATYKVVVHLFEEPTADELNDLKEYMRIDFYSNVTHFVYGEEKGDSISKIYSLSFVKLIESATPLKLFTDDINNNASDTYIVIFKEWTPENKDKVLSVEGVRYIRDTTFSDQGYPAIIIISNQSSVEKIGDFNFIYNVQKVIPSENVMPKSTNGLEFPIILIVIILLSYKIGMEK